MGGILEAFERSIDDPGLEPRQRDMLREILERLEEGDRVVHVVGTPGVGKSYAIGRVIEILLTSGGSDRVCFYVAPERLLGGVEKALKDKLSGSSDVLRLKNLDDYECEIPVSEFLRGFREDPKLSRLPKCAPRVLRGGVRAGRWGRVEARTLGLLRASQGVRGGTLYLEPVR